MPGRTVEPGRSNGQAWRERMAVVAVGGGIVSVVAVYLVLNATSGRDAARDLLPYQTLVRTLPEPDQRLFRALREGLLAAEADRARSAAWPDADALAARGVAPFAEGAGYRWSRV